MNGAILEWVGPEEVSMRHVLVIAALALAMPAAAQTLDVAIDGDDLVFTWGGGTDDLLRGTEPDGLTPWMPSVTSPLRVPGENALRGENAWYRLASGSNIAFRVEVFVPRHFPTRPDWPCMTPLTLADRRQVVTARDLLDLWPTLVEVQWWDVDAGIHRGVTRYGSEILGPDTPLPGHGGIMVAFSEDTTVTIVGSGDPSAPGITEEELRDRFLYGGAAGVLPVPPHARWDGAYELLCGEQGVDWQDDDLDGRPDTACGRDTDGDGAPDTGLWAGEHTVGVSGYADGRACTLRAHAQVAEDIFGQFVIFGSSFPLVPGYGVLFEGDYEATLNTPFRPPTW